MSWFLQIPEADGEQIAAVIDALELPETLRRATRDEQLVAAAGPGEPLALVYYGGMSGHANSGYKYGGFVSVTISGGVKPAENVE